MESWVKQWGVVAGIAVIGIIILGYGVWGVIAPSSPTIEIIKGEVEGASVSVGEIVVDVEGAVEKPGVYKLPSNSRIGDALVAAGGLSAQADRGWVAATLNLAGKVEDGAKIYIPAKSGNQNAQKVGTSDVQKTQTININTASLTELDQLSGIGEVRAKAIIDNRPYATTEEVVTKAKVPDSVYQQIKDQISVY